MEVGKQDHCLDEDGLEGQNQSLLMLLLREFFGGVLGKTFQVSKFYLICHL